MKRKAEESEKEELPNKVIKLSPEEENLVNSTKSDNELKIEKVETPIVQRECFKCGKIKELTLKCCEDAEYCNDCQFKCESCNKQCCILCQEKDDIKECTQCADNKKVTCKGCDEKCNEEKECNSCQKSICETCEYRCSICFKETCEKCLDDNDDNMLCKKCVFSLSEIKIKE